MLCGNENAACNVRTHTAEAEAALPLTHSLALIPDHYFQVPRMMMIHRGEMRSASLNSMHYN
jgi:hypothetical protein